MAPSRDRRPGFSRRAQYTLFASYILAIAGALVGAVLLVLSQFNPPAFAALRSAASEVTAPVSTGVAAVFRGIAAVPETVGTYFRVHGENEALRAEVKRTHEALVQARVIVRDNRRLRGLLKLREATPDTVVTARIVSSTASSTRRFGVLNAGRWQGVRPGMPVRGPDGLIGRVIETGPNTARVLFATDAESVIPVRRIGDGLPALAAGRGDGTLDIRSVGTANAKLRPGDRFVTSGTGGIFTPGVLVARVTAAGSDNAPARPYGDPDTFDFAIVSAPFLPRKPFDTPLPHSRARALPWATVMLGSLVTIFPVATTLPLLPPCGLLMLLAWRLLAPLALRRWTPALLGLFDDCVSGQPLGSGMLLWSLTFFLVDLFDQRTLFRAFTQDWLIAAGAIAFCLIGGRLIATPLGAHVDSVLVAQIIVSILLFPFAARVVAWVDRRRVAE